MHKVGFVATEDRRKGVEASVAALGGNPVRGKNVLLKPNFNTADPTPGSTHNDTLVAIVDLLWEMGATGITLGERSYPPTAEVMDRKGVRPLMAERDVRILDFDTLGPEDWVPAGFEGDHWRNGFRVARPVLEAECLVSTCCLKTHQFGGVITLSLKLHVGVVPTFRNGFDCMADLHGSPHQQEMIAEINRPFAPDLVILDGLEAFIDGGPAAGRRKAGAMFAASGDRVSIDAVGVAVLKHLGSNPAIMNRPIFEQRQIARAVELGLGASSPAEIQLVAANRDSIPYCRRVEEILQKG